GERGRVLLLDGAADVGAGVVDEDVEAAEGLVDGAEHGLACGGIAEIRGERARVAAAVADAGGHRFEPGGAARRDRDAGARVGEALRGSRADAFEARGAGDENDLAREASGHAYLRARWARGGGYRV